MENTNPVSGFSTMTSAIAGAGHYHDWIMSFFSGYIGSSILEVGTGFGNYRRYFRDAKVYVSIDIDEQAVLKAAERNDGVYIKADISDPGCVAMLDKYAIDTILCTNVLEHVHDDHSAVANMCRMLRKGGCLLLAVPAHGFLFNRLDELAGHQRRYCASALRELFALASLTEVSVKYINPIGAVGWLANGMFRHSSLDSSSLNRQVVYFDRYVLPFSRVMNKLTSCCFGQSLVAIARREI